MVEIASRSAPVSVFTSVSDKKSHKASTTDWLCVPPPPPPPHPSTITFLPLGLDRHMYDNVDLKGECHLYDDEGKLRDSTPDLIPAVKPKVPLEDEQVTD